MRQKKTPIMEFNHHDTLGIFAHPYSALLQFQNVCDYLWQFIGMMRDI